MLHDNSPNRPPTPNTIDDIQVLRVPSKWENGKVAFQHLAYGLAEKFVQAIHLFEATHQLEVENIHDEGLRTSLSKFTLTEECFRDLKSEILNGVSSPHPTLRGGNLASLTFSTPWGDEAKIRCIVSEQSALLYTPSGKGVSEWEVLSVTALPKDDSPSSIKTSAWQQTPFDEAQLTPPTDSSILRDFLEERFANIPIIARVGPHVTLVRDESGDHIEIQELPTELKARQIIRYLEQNFAELICDYYPYEYEEFPGTTYWAVTVQCQGQDRKDRDSF